ncbi:MAG: response regulator [Lacunisphaera sp.]
MPPIVTVPFRKKIIQVAVVDDHDNFRRAITFSLQAKGMLAVSFASVAEFVRSTAIHAIDCLLLDMEMPEIDGMRCLSVLRDTNFKFPVIFCTGSANEDRKTETETLGAYCIHLKPVDIDLLVNQIRAACLVI